MFFCRRFVVLIIQVMFVVHASECQIQQKLIASPNQYVITLEDTACLDEYIEHSLLVNDSVLDKYVQGKITNLISNKADNQALSDLDKKLQKALEDKIDKSIVNAALNLKAEKSDLNTTVVEFTKQLTDLSNNKANVIDVNAQNVEFTKSLDNLSDSKADIDSVVLNENYQNDMSDLQGAIDKKADKGTLPNQSEFEDKIYTTLSQTMLPYLVKVINPDQCPGIGLGVPSPFEKGESFSETFINEPVGKLLLAPILARHDDQSHVGNLVFSKIQDDKVLYTGPIISITTATHSHLNPQLTCNASTDFSNCGFLTSQEKIQKIDNHTLQVLCG